MPLTLPGKRHASGDREEAKDMLTKATLVAAPSGSAGGAPPADAWPEGAEVQNAAKEDTEEEAAEEAEKPEMEREKAEKPKQHLQPEPARPPPRPGAGRGTAAAAGRLGFGSSATPPFRRCPRGPRRRHRWGPDPAPLRNDGPRFGGRRRRTG